MRATIRPLLISLLLGSKKNNSQDKKRVDLLHKLSSREIEQLDDAITAFLRVEIDKMVIDKLISDRYKGMSGNNQTATDGS